MWRFFFYMSRFFSLLFGVMASCLPVHAAPPWGSYGGPLKVQLLPYSRNIELLEDFTYIDPMGTNWIAPKGLVSDGASIPQPFWSIVGGPLDGPYREGAVIHDEYCDTKTCTWEAAANVFYQAMRCSNVGFLKAKTMYYAVYWFGPHWKPGAFSGASISAINASQSGAYSATSNDLGMASLSQADREAKQIDDWVEANDPSLEKMRATNPSEISSVPAVDLSKYEAR
jgi:hypothetical protein